MHVADATVAAQLVVQTIEAITHGLIIHPRGGIDPNAYAREAAILLESYLTAGGEADRSTGRSGANHPAGGGRRTGG